MINDRVPMTKIIKKLKGFLPVILGLAIVFLTYVYGAEIGAFTGFPKGYDAYGHMSPTRIVRDSWPYLYWNPYWDSGTGLLIRSYPPTTYLLGAFMSKFFSWSLEKVFIFLAEASLSLIVLGVFCFVFILTGKIIPSLLASLLLISSPAFWAYVIEGGFYTRTLSTAPLVFAWLFICLYIQRERKERWNIWYFLSILSLYLAATTHQLAVVWAILSVVFLVSRWAKTRLELITKVLYLFVPVGLLGAFYYFPLVFTLGNNTPSWGKFPGQLSYAPVSLARLFKPVSTVAAVPVILIPLALISIFLRFGQKIKKESQKNVLEVSKVMVVLAAISLCYAFGLFGGYIYGVCPHTFLFYFVLFLSIFVGLGFGLVQKVAPVERILLLALCGVIIFSWQKQIPGLKKRAVDYSRMHQGTFQSVIVDANDMNYRFGNASEVVAGWFNLENMSPQTRDYHYLDPLYPDWQYFLEYTVWTKDESYNETNFLLDWYGVKNFVVNPPTGGVRRVSPGKFANRTEYKEVGQYGFAYQQATPILSASNTPVVAVVADQSSYDVLVRDLALGNLNSQVLIPLKIGERVSDLDREDLSRFDGVILYGFKGGIGGRTALKLTEYLKEGGWLLIEKSKEGLRGELPDPWPLKRSFPTTIGGDWQWEGNESGGKVDFGEGNWGVEVAGDVKNWAQPLVFFQDQPVVVEGQLDKGKVIWSGLNLPYHLSVSGDPEELKFFQDSLLSLLKKEEERKTVDFEARFVHNQRREIEVKEKAKGILFKESYFPNWKAYVQTSNKIRIYPAGPMMMYVPLSNEEFPLKVVLSYQVSFMEKAGLVISLITFGLLIIFLLRSLGQMFIYRLKLALDKF